MIIPYAPIYRLYRLSRDKITHIFGKKLIRFRFLVWKYIYKAGGEFDYYIMS
ncbi:hypothetical protein STZ1_20520 [Bacillus subtilis]